MTESKEKIKIPTKEGLARARKKLKDMYHKGPSPELVKIIDEVTQDKKQERRDIAARPHSPEAEV